MTTAGIDDLQIYGGPLSVNFADIAAARDLPDKALQAVKFNRRSVPPLLEDPVTLGVNAALPIVEAQGRDAFELLIVATETSVDYGKPLSTYVHRHLGLDERCRNFEIKHACFGGTAALQTACSWVRSGDARGKKALIVMTDLARRHFTDAAELTGGAGAVAISVSAEPELMAIESGSGYASFEVYDVARPSATGEWGDPVLSLNAFLDLLDAAWSGYRDIQNVSTDLEKEFGHLLYHTPLVSLIEQAHKLLLEEHDFDVTADAIAASFERMVAPSLRFCRELGNTYSASLYTAIAGLLHDAVSTPADRIGLFSYGSGACAEFFSGRFVDGAAERIRSKKMDEGLSQRRSVSVSEYEGMVIEMEKSLTASEYQPSDAFGLADSHYAGTGLLILDRVDNHHRQYRRN